MSEFDPYERLSDYLDGELSQDELASLEADLEADADLREELEDLRVVVDGLRDAPAVRAPEGFTARVLERLEDEGLGSGLPAGAANDDPLPGALYRAGLWAAGPVAAALAAMLVLWIGVRVVEQPSGGAVAEAPQMASAPAPTGQGVAEGDGVVDELFPAATPGPDLEVTTGGTVPAARPARSASRAPAPARRSGIREAKSSAPRDVYMAEFERAPESASAQAPAAEEDQELAVAAADDPDRDADKASDWSPEPTAEAESLEDSDDGVALADEPAAVAPALDETAGFVDAEAARAPRDVSSAGASRRKAAAPATRSRDTSLAHNALLRGAGAAEALLRTCGQRGWICVEQPVPGAGRSLRITVPDGQQVGLESVLRELGQLRMGSFVVRDGSATLRVVVQP